MIYVICHYLGLPQPTETVAVIIAISFIFAVLLGGMWWSLLRRDAQWERTKNSRLLTQARNSYRRYKSFEQPVTDLLRPALLNYQHMLFRRDGITYDLVEYSIGSDAITLRAGQDGVAEKHHRKMAVPLTCFDPGCDVTYVIEGMVAERKDSSDAEIEERMCPHCDGEGEARVRGIRTVTGYDRCVHCGGTGEKA